MITIRLGPAEIRFFQYVEYMTMFLCSLPALILEILNFKVAMRRKEKAKPPRVIIFHMATWVGSLVFIVLYSFYVVVIWRPYPVRIHANGWIMFFLGSGVYDGISISGMCITLMLIDRTIILVNPAYLDVTKLPRIFFRIWAVYVVVMFFGTAVFEFPLQWDTPSLTYFDAIPQYHSVAIFGFRVLVAFVNFCLFLRLVAAVRSHYSHFENRCEMAERVVIVATIFQGVHGVMPQAIRLLSYYFKPSWYYISHVYSAFGLSLELVVTVHAHWKLLRDMKNSVIPQSAKPPQRGSTHFSTPYD